MGVRYPTSGAVSAASSLIFSVEAPTGSINGINTTFTLTNAPRTPQISNLAVFLNGVIQTPNVDYTINTKTITFAVAPLAGDVMLVCYAALV